MRVALICGSLEPGRDGVGDYSRQLAAEIIRQGHDACLVSLADRTAKDVVEEIQEANGVGVRALCIPGTAPWAQRVAVAREFLERTQVFQLSFQFVCYAYSPKGVVRMALPFLVRLAECRKVHIMFHELWIGEYMNAPIKERLVGKLQRHFIKKLVGKLSPMAIHTSNPAYVAILGSHGICAEMLPLFGNIPVNTDKGTDRVMELFRQQGVDIPGPSRDASWVGGIFGSIHPEWKPGPFLDEFADAASRERKTAVIAGLGRFGAGGDRIWSEMVAAHRDRVRFALLGPLPAGTISQVLRVLDFGISTTPWRVFGKSGTGAAMTDHGLPVVVTRDDWRPLAGLKVEFNHSPLVRRFDSSFMNDFRGFLAGKREPAGACPTVAKRFVEALSRA